MSVNRDVLIVMLTPYRTYEDCEFRPGPHLNVLLGPNGMKLMLLAYVYMHNFKTFKKIAVYLVHYHTPDL